MKDAPSPQRASVRVGLIGEGIQASRSPALHASEAAAQGLDLRYELFDTAQAMGGTASLPALLSRAEAEGLAGVNVTHPFKQAVIAHLDALSDDARALGAVNTVVFEGGRRIGHNTDWSGFAESLRRGLPEADLQSVVQLGAGGAGVAVAHALLVLGTGRLTIVDTDRGKASEAAAALNARLPGERATVAGDPSAAMAGASGLVNATPIGMASHPGLPLAEGLLRSDLWVADIVYFPLETALLAAARAKGCRTLDGGGMAVFQAVGAFRLFTGLEPDAARMLAHFQEMARPLAFSASR